MVVVRKILAVDDDRCYDNHRDKVEHMRSIEIELQNLILTPGSQVILCLLGMLGAIDHGVYVHGVDPWLDNEGGLTDLVRDWATTRMR